MRFSGLLLGVRSLLLVVIILGYLSYDLPLFYYHGRAHPCVTCAGVVVRTRCGESVSIDRSRVHVPRVEAARSGWDCCRCDSMRSGVVICPMVLAELTVGARREEVCRCVNVNHGHGGFSTSLARSFGRLLYQLRRLLWMRCHGHVARLHFDDD